jgi:hypothetical protein
MIPLVAVSLIGVLHWPQLQSLGPLAGLARRALEAKRDAAHPPDHQRLLNRLHHPDRDVGVAPQQIVDGVRQYEFDFERWMVFPQPGENRRQHFRADRPRSR